MARCVHWSGWLSARRTIGPGAAGHFEGINRYRHCWVICPSGFLRIGDGSSKRKLRSPKAELWASTHNVAFVTDVRSNLEEQDIGGNNVRPTQSKNLCPPFIVSEKAEGIMPLRPSFKIFVSPEDTHGNTSAKQRT